MYKQNLVKWNIRKIFVVLRSAVLALANNIINDPNYSSGGGGGDSSDLRWDGRKPGEDEDSFARRCLLYASQQVARNRKKGLHR